MTKKFKSMLPPDKTSNYSILAPLEVKALTISDLMFKRALEKQLKALLSERLFYISHPCISSLECSINLNLFANTNFFEEKVKEILAMANFNPKQIEKRDKSQTILFKDVAAMKLLNIIFKDNENHVLYPIYLKWIDGSEWMSIP